MKWNRTGLDSVLRFGIHYVWTGGDPFGAATKYWPWEDGTNSVSMAKRRS